ncbi:zinc finger protein 37-like [Cheilinus undulatus]|uniref:zinc finger protein 37-like n=1 Tax=Cheilinus undulatus TaxID=241271 RepID=UPI001BD28735|nr:zinc finger protein 37-like [Cheilinus undulatus]
MPGVETLRDFVNQRLTAAAEDIFGVFVRTIAEYEEQLCRCKEENERKQKLLDDVQLRFHRADNQQLSVTQEEAPSVPRSSSLEQEDTEPPHIKEEQEELRSSQEGLDQAYTIKFPFAPAPVKTEDEEEKPRSSQLNEIQSEGMKTGTDGQECGGPEQAWNSESERHSHSETQDKTEDCSEAETDDSDGWRVTMEHDYGLNCVENFDDDRSDNDKKSHSCSQCSKTFTKKCHLATHMGTHKKEEPFNCPECEKKFNQKITRNIHMLVHTGEKPYNCSECNKKFNQKFHLITHMLMHTKVKPFSCSECNKTFNYNSKLTSHMMIHTGEKPFSCCECDKKFNRKSHLNRHMLVHTGEKPFSCSECDQKFNHNSKLTSHMGIHTGEKPFSCELCNQKFSWITQVKKHKCTGRQTS